jgi:predicted  nucleic acid-binding Zn-ribbon protein
MADHGKLIEAHDRALGEARRAETRVGDLERHADDLKREVEALRAEIAHTRELGAQARQAADERREELEAVLRELMPFSGRAYEPGAALEAARRVRSAYEEEQTGGADDVVLPRACVAELVEALEGAWWVKAAAALSRMSDALIEGGS